MIKSKLEVGPLAGLLTHKVLTSQETHSPFSYNDPDGLFNMRIDDPVIMLALRRDIALAGLTVPDILGDLLAVAAHYAPNANDCLSKYVMGITTVSCANQLQQHIPDLNSSPVQHDTLPAYLENTTIASHALFGSSECSLGSLDDLAIAYMTVAGLGNMLYTK